MRGDLDPTLRCVYLDRRARPCGVRLALLVPSWPARTIVLLVRLTASRSA
jgi:hypothetical protein